MTIAGYMGWFVPFHTARGYVSPYDFPLIPLEYKEGVASNSDQYFVGIYRDELKLMADHGWNTVAVDGLFFDDKNVKRQLNLMDLFIRAAAGIKGEPVKIIPFIEFSRTIKNLGVEKSADFFAKNISLMLQKYGSSGLWRKIDGRPVIKVYMASEFPLEFWRKVLPAIKSSGYDPFWIMELSGLQPALYGTYDVKRYKPYMELFDGVYNFGCSGLVAAANFPVNVRKNSNGTKAAGYLGATLWPGYLSDRPYNKNFISHDGTAFLRKVWNASKKAAPDFLHWVWNDFKESTTLTCSYSTLTSRLEIAQRFLNEFNKTPLPVGSPDEPQTVLSYRKSIYSGESLSFEFLPLPTLKGPVKGKVCIRLLNDKGEVLAEQASTMLDLKTMTPWIWRVKRVIKRSDTLTVKVRPEITLSDGRVIKYNNIPDIAVVQPLALADQLYYSIPLHRIARGERKLELKINGISSLTGRSAYHEGLRRIEYIPHGAAKGGAMVASMRNGHALRFLAGLNIGGAEMLTPGQNSRWLRLWKNRSSDKSYVDWRPSDNLFGSDYYAAVVRFPDGKWAYSSTIWTKRSFSTETLAAMWLFVPNATSKNEVIDRSVGRHNLVFAEKSKKWPYVVLRGDARAMSFKGQYLTSSLDTVPYGPVTLEAAFKPGKATGSKQIICYQRGAQAALSIDAEGYLVGARLPQERKHPNPFVKIRSRKPVEAGKFVHVVLTYDMKTLNMYINGELANSAPCSGTRSCEGFSIGGAKIDGASKAVDEISGKSLFNGEMLRVSIIGAPMPQSEITAIYQRLRMMPFWK